MAVDREFVYIVWPWSRAWTWPRTIGDLLRPYLNLGSEFPSKSSQIAERVIKNGPSQDTPPDQPDQQIEFQAMKISQAIERAGLSKDQISHVNSHASGEIEVDRVAACSIQAALGDVDVVAYKGFFGNAGPAGGILESCISINALHEDALPATLNCDSVAPDCPVSVLKENRKETQTAAVKTTTSDTGQMVAVVFEQDV